MKRSVLGVLAGVGLVATAIALAEQQGTAFAQRPAAAAPAPAATAGAELIVAPALVGEKSQMLTVIDPRQRVLSVYHIDLVTGKIVLKSVRNIQWDLQMTYLNNENPLPQEIRALLEQR